MTQATNLIREGSVAWSVVQFLETNPDEQLDADIISAKYDCSRSTVHTQLGAAVQAGQIVRSKDPGTGDVVYSAPKQSVSIVERCIAAYRSSPDIDTACRVAGVHKLTMFKILKFNNVMLISDRLKVGSHNSRIGASAEQEFQRLVPMAKSINAICSSNPGFDFDANGWRVDVKAASPLSQPNRKKTTLVWRPRLSNGGPISDHVDLLCIFLLPKGGGMVRAGDYQVYLVPADLVRGRCYLQKTENIPCELDTFEMRPAELAGFFKTEGGQA